MKEGLIEEEVEDDLKKALNNYKIIVRNISNYYKKIKDNDGESNNISKKKIINDIKKYKKHLDKLLNEKKNSNNSGAKIIIDKYLEKNKEEVEKYIEEIQNELKQKEVDMRVEEIGEENNEKEGNLQQQPQVELDLVNTHEFLEERGKEIKEIYKVSAIINETTGMMREQVNQQGETINRIEKNVDQTKENVDQANVEINKANELSKGNNKRISYIVGITVIAVGLVLALVIWSLN